MDFVSIILFLVMYYIRPQEWGELFSKVHFAQLVMGFALLSLFFRERSLKWGNLFRTPHDWMVLAFWLWLVLTSPTPWETFKATNSLFLTYIIIVQTLVTLPRIKQFVGWWTFLIIAIAALAIASQYGFDPLGSYDLTEGRMKGRLALNLSIFRNPNALGHNVVPAIPMLFFFSIWRRPIFLQEVGYALIGLPLWCIYLTFSKGSFLVAGITVVATATFGRPKAVQAAIITLAIFFGGVVIWKLPRMNELDRSKTDGAIMGRVAAFTHGMKMIQSKTFGIGHAQWLKSFFAAHHYGKAAHSSYVQTGAETGKVGLFLFVGILYCNLRTLMMAKTATDDEERIRRILFVLVLTYMVSCWMVDLAYRPTFFMFTAATAALHRHLRGICMEEPAEESALTPALPKWRGLFVPQPALAGASSSDAVLALGAAPPIQTVEVHSSELSTAAAQAITAPLNRWNKIGLIDLAIIATMTYGVLRMWQLAIQRM